MAPELQVLLLAWIPLLWFLTPYSKAALILQGFWPKITWTCLVYKRLACVRSNWLNLPGIFIHHINGFGKHVAWGQPVVLHQGIQRFAELPDERFANGSEKP